jgi:hypothetical protein
MEIFLGALEVMGFGVSGVFLVLAVFFLLVKLMLKVFPAKQRE